MTSEKKETKRTVTWNLISGKIAMVTITAGTTDAINADGIEVTGRVVLRIRATVDGTLVGYTEPTKVVGKSVPYALGKLGLTEEQYGLVTAAIEAVTVESGLAAIRARADEVDAKYEAHTEMMRRAMAE